MGIARQMEPLFHRAAAYLRVGGYRGKLVGVAAIAAACPTVALWHATDAGPVAAAEAIGTGLALVVFAYLLRPVGLVAAGLRACAEPGDQAPAPGGEAGRMVADVQALSARLELLRHRLNHRHPVTGLPTREPFLALLPDADRAQAETGVLGVIRFTDYDDLAAFDQARADSALAAFATRLESAVQPNRPLAQVDRDCFALWFSGAEAVRAATGELQAIAYVLEQELGDADLRIAPEVGLGAAVFPGDATDPPALLTRAFAALSKPGQAAPGRLSFFSPAASDAARERFSIEQGLRNAINREQLLLHYQPVFDVGAGRVVGAEALLRWRHPDLGLVPPGKFIPVLEQSGMMDEVGLWVLNAACRQSRTWEDQGLLDLTMAVNLSARQCRDPGLATQIMRTLERHGVRPGSLELELTETAAMEDAQGTRALLGDLRALGIGVALDDFGAGYSSLTYLKNLPFSKLKIDREFVDRIDERRDSQAICAALVELSRRLEISILAEGVERPEEVDTLRKLGCSMFQGFLFARPLPASEFVRTVTDPAFGALAVPAKPKAAVLKQKIAQ
jgi:EAL domain-containing protein (putative c-di-GMP-specific phosphodiesterase class I)/GGDEF domain-containing protein